NDEKGFNIELTQSNPRIPLSIRHKGHSEMEMEYCVVLIGVKCQSRGYGFRREGLVDGSVVTSQRGVFKVMDLLSSLESVIAMASTAASSSVDAAAAAAAANRGAVDIPVSNFPFDPSLFSNNSTTTITPPTSSHDTQKNKRNRTRKRNNDNSNNNNQLIIPNHTQIDTSQVSSELIEQSLSPFRVGKNWACRICGREFTRRFNCTTHERTHLDLKERAQFQCRLCPRPLHSDHLQILDQNNTTSHLEPLLLMNEPAAATTTTTMCTTTNQARSNTTATMVLSDQTNPPTAILTSGSIRGISQGIERVPIEQIQDYNPGMEIIFKFDKKWACGTCGRIFVRRNNCKAHEATHRDIREHQCSTCSRSFSLTTTETTKTKTRKGKGTKRLKLTSTQSRVLPPQTHAMYIERLRVILGGHSRLRRCAGPQELRTTTKKNFQLLLLPLLTTPSEYGQLMLENSPTEILNRILEHSDPIDVASFARVTRFTYQLIYSEPNRQYLWHELFLNHFDKPDHNILLNHPSTIKNTDDSDNIDWLETLAIRIRLRQILTTNDDILLKERLSKHYPDSTKLLELYQLIFLILNTASSTDSLNVTFLRNILANRSSQFRIIHYPALNHQIQPIFKERISGNDPLVSSAARLHVHYGLTRFDLNGRRARNIARESVYHFKNYTKSNLYGPFMDSQSCTVNWSHLESLSVLVGFNLFQISTNLRSYLNGDDEDNNLLPTVPLDPPQFVMPNQEDEDFSDQITPDFSTRNGNEEIRWPMLDSLNSARPNTQLMHPAYKKKPLLWPYEFNSNDEDLSIPRPPVSLDLDLYDWAGVNGVWTRMVCYLNWRHLTDYNDPNSSPLVLHNYKETVRVMTLKLRVVSIGTPPPLPPSSPPASSASSSSTTTTSTTPPPPHPSTSTSTSTTTATEERTTTPGSTNGNRSDEDPDLGINPHRDHRIPLHVRTDLVDRPPIYFEGTSAYNRGASGCIPGGQRVSTIRGCVSITKDGEVRWTSVSTSEHQDRWASEGIQIGGVRSMWGVLGVWSDVNRNEIEGPESKDRKIVESEKSWNQKDRN
ncbi:hypothetical protein PSHT_15230, partial [Puccinia striiformis]